MDMQKDEPVSRREAGLRIPKAEDNFFLKSDVTSYLELIERLSRLHPVNILVAGKQGCGKSTLVRQFAARTNRSLATFQVGILSEPGQLFGEHRLRNGRTCYQEFLFPKAIQTPRCVIHLEEINRPEHPKALNMLFSLLSEDRSVWIDELGCLDVAEGVIFFATLNEGDEFIGTEMLDAALRDRFYVMMLDYLPPAVETDVLHRKTGIGESEALTIVNIAEKLRNNHHEPILVSTRHTLMIAELVNLGATVRDAFVNSLQLGKDTLETILLSLHLEAGFFEKSNGDGYQAF